MSPLEWLRDHLADLDTATGIFASPEGNAVAIYGRPGDLAPLRNLLGATPGWMDTHVHTWVAKVDGVTISLVEQGVVA